MGRAHALGVQVLNCSKVINEAALNLGREGETFHYGASKGTQRCSGVAVSAHSREPAAFGTC